MKRKPIKNKILHAVRTPTFKSRVYKDRKKEMYKTGKYLEEY